MVIEVIPIGITNIGWKVFLIFAIFNLAYIPIVYFLFPETAGFSLEMVDLCFTDRTQSPVKRSKQLRAALKRGETINLTDSVLDEKIKQSAVHVEVAVSGE